jgi:hypothetical protein
MFNLSTVCSMVIGNYVKVKVIVHLENKNFLTILDAYIRSLKAHRYNLLRKDHVITLTIYGVWDFVQNLLLALLLNRKF